MHITVLSCSLDPHSRSRRLAAASLSMIRLAGHDATLVDLHALGGLPPFDNDQAFDDPRYALLHSSILSADGVVIASPVYNWSLSSAAKNLIELTGATGVQGRRSAWFDKVVTFVCTGGLAHSYMAFGATSLSLMLDFKCIVNPHTVYATDTDWADDGEPAEALVARLQKVMTIKLELADRLQARSCCSSWET